MATAPSQDSPPSPPPLSTTPPPSSSPTPPSSPLTSSPPPVSSPPPNDTSPPPAFSPPPPTTNASPPPTNQGTSPPNSNSSPPPPSSNIPSSPPPLGSNGNNNNSSPTTPPPPGSNGSNNSPPSPSPPKSSGSHHTPPPPRSLGTPSSRSSSNDTSSSISGSSGNNTIPILIGVVVGVGALFILAMLIYCCVGKKKKKKGRSSQPEYYTFDHSHAHNRQSNYYNSPPQHNWQSPQQPNDHHFSNLPPPPGINHGSQWASPPPQSPPPFPVGIPSGEMGSNYSGPQGSPLPPPHPSIALGFTKSNFSYDELAVATGGFSQVNLLGQGGFGYVHKGVLPNGKEIAVKSLKAGSGQGDREFQAEVEIISRVHHRHLVSLVGYCIAGGQKILVYEFVPNNTLEFHLYGKGRPPLDWNTRVKIALGSAKGLAYLHEDCHPRIIHRDIKAANILIDDNFEAKVADFGLAKLSSDNYTHVSTRIMGTFGYLAPEYASSGKLTEKSDVFSFGVMLLELITGRRPVDLNSDMDESLVDWARPLCQSALETGNYIALADPRLEGDYDLQEMARMVACAGASVRHSARRRPKMSQIVRALEGDMSLEHLNDGPKTSQSSTFSTTSGSTEIHDSASYGADMKKFRKMALNSNEYTSSEYGHTSEYGLNPSSSSSDEVSRTTGMGSRRLSP